MTVQSETTLHGIGVSAGVAIGPVARMAEPIPPPVDEAPPADPEAAKAAIADALETVAADLERRAGLVDATAAEILNATAMMARDPSLHAGADRRVSHGQGPATAVNAAVEEACAGLAAAGGYLAERVTDLRDVRDRVVAALLGRPQPGVPELTTPSVLVARDLAPADAAGLSPATVLAIVTEVGGPTSHTAILAAQLGIPAVVGLSSAGEGNTDLLRDGVDVAVDGDSGAVVVAPERATRDEWARRAEQRVALLARFSGPGHTADGRPVALLANVGSVPDAVAAAEQDVEGVGLFRTEFLYLDRSTAPPVEEQTRTYLEVLGAFGQRRVIVRTLDAGADKPLAFAPSGEETNPALGVRGLRLSQQEESLLDDQLAAIAAAAARSEADVWVMAPMVSTPAEARWFAERARAAGLARVGAMIEVPSAALRAGEILAELDFGSIGTNDLAQYTMGADRMLGGLSSLLDPWQPAVLDLVASTTAGAGESVPVGVCGEAAGDPLLALVLVGLGVSSLSMAVAKVPAVRAALAQHDFDRCVDMAEVARAASSPRSARAAVAELASPDVP